jgi:molybdopterin synthase catalytic subunit
MTVSVQSEDFDIAHEIASLSAGAHEIGAVASFVGKVRGHIDGKPLASMTLEHYPGMTEDELERIAADATQRFELISSRIVHRVGTLKPGDNIVLVVTCAPHRHSALAACDFLMDYLKSRAPFWKKEVLLDGTVHWVDARESDLSAVSRWTGIES